MIINETISNLVNAPVRQFGAKVELYNSADALLYTFTDQDNLKGYTIERLGDESKFFGFGVKQKLNLKVLDTKREINIPTHIRVKIGLSMPPADYIYPYADFYTTETHRDEKTGELSITAYDRLDTAKDITISNTNINYTSVSIADVANVCGNLLGVSDIYIPTTIGKIRTQIINDPDGTQYNQYFSYTLQDDNEILYCETWGMIERVNVGGVEFTENYESIRTYPQDLGDISDLWKAGTVVEVYCNSDSFVNVYAEYDGIAVDKSFNTFYSFGINVEGTETVETILNAIAEATQTVYFINHNQELEFKIPSRDADAALTIGKQAYFTLDSKTNRRLTAISSITELGDNLIVETGEIGTTQYIKDNPFYNTAEGVSKGTDELLNDAIKKIGGLTINQFVCSWRGNPLLEIGDKIALETKDNSLVYSFVFNDVIEYDGGYNQNTQWLYSDESPDVNNNPSTIGELITDTFARVDKVNKEIELLAKEVDTNSESISTLQLDTDSITAAVSRVEESTAANDETIADLTKRVEASITAEQAQIQIQNELANGVDKVITSTGFVFDDTGLTVSKSDSEITTTISEDGMQVFKSNDAVLTANNAGVNALNLHATTYLIIGNNSRFEDFKGNRTACFWIGG